MLPRRERVRGPHRQPGTAKSFPKASLAPWEAIWLDFLGKFGITKLSLVKGKVEVVGEALSRAPQTLAKPPASMNNLSVESLEFYLPENFIQNYIDDKIFGSMCNGLNGKLPDDPKQHLKVEKVLPFFQLKDDILYK